MGQEFSPSFHTPAFSIPDWIKGILFFCFWVLILFQIKEESRFTCGFANIRNKKKYLKRRTYPCFFWAKEKESSATKKKQNHWEEKPK